jgi:zinc protease
MKKYRWLGLMLLSLLFISLLRLPAAAQSPRHYDRLDFPALPEIQLPQYERYKLANGMVVYLMQDHQLPLVSGTALIRTGTRLEPAEKVGLAEITTTVMRTGGTEQHSPEALNELLEDRAAVVETGIDNTSATVSFSALSEDLPTTFNLFAEVIKEPAFAPEQFALAQTQTRGAIARRNDDPGDIASREFKKLIYGDTSPYARTVEYATLDQISREDARQFYQTYVRPENIILGIVGDFEPAAMKQQIEQAFGGWNPPPAPKAAPLPQISQQRQGGIFFADQPQLTQSSILFGHLGGKLDSPDYPALSVLNGVLNGFGGRLFNEVRSRQGLAYSVYGFWQPNYDYPGLFIAGGQTRSEATVPFVQSLHQEIERLRSEPISEAELTYAKDSILNSFVFNFENPSQTLARLMRYEYFGYPADFIFQYQRGVKAATAQDVQRVANKYLHPDRAVTLVVGNAKAIQPPLGNLGEAVQSLDVSIPPPK